MGFSTIPLPKVVSDVGPGGPLVTSENALLNNQILGAQAHYAPQQAQANAYLTAQQGAWYPFQQLNNPLMWMAAQGNPALQQQISKMINNLPVPQPLGNGWPLPPPQSSNPLADIGSAFMQKLGISQPSQNAMQQMPQQQAPVYGNALSRPVNVAPSGSPSNDPINQLPQAPGSSTQPTMQSPQAASAPQPQVSNEGTIKTPIATPAGNYQGGDYAQMNVAPDLAKALANSNVINSSDENKEAGKKATAAINAGNMLKAYDEAWKLSQDKSVTGPIRGHLASDGLPAGVLDALGLLDLTPGQITNKLGAQIQTEMGKGIFSKFAGPEISLMRSQKLDQTMTSGTEQAMVNQGISGLMRGSEELPFYVALDSPSLNASPTEKKLLFTNYSKSYPPYETVDGKIVPNPTSLNGTPLWKYWTTPAGINAARSGNTTWQPPGWDNITKQAKDQYQQQQAQLEKQKQQVSPLTKEDLKQFGTNVNYQASKKINGKDYYKLNNEWYSR